MALAGASNAAVIGLFHHAVIQQFVDGLVEHRGGDGGGHQRGGDLHVVVAKGFDIQM